MPLHEIVLWVAMIAALAVGIVCAIVGRITTGRWW